MMVLFAEEHAFMLCDVICFFYFYVNPEPANCELARKV
jgi:hypothetical protein